MMAHDEGAAGYSSDHHEAISVVGRRFCVARPVDLVVSERVWQLTGRGNCVVKDSDGNLMFKVKEMPFSTHDRKIIFDDKDMPILTLRSKRYSQRSRWQVFRGDSKEQKDLIFSARRSSVFQMKTKLHVFLANNTTENECDFTIQGTWFSGACKVFVGDSANLIAQMHQNPSIGSTFTGKDKLKVRVHPNVDYGFILALIIILEGIRSHSQHSSN